MSIRRVVPFAFLSALALGPLASSSSMAAAQDVEARPSLAEPGISPDGSEIAFVSGADIWTVPSSGGAARLLVAHSADESLPRFSPDGTKLAFNSNRDGSVDVHVMDLGTGQVTRLTYSSGSEQLNGWSRDSEWVYFSSSDEDISSMNDVFRVRASGGTPASVAGDRYETEFFAAPSPQPGLMAISTRGNMGRSQWWRNGHSHIDEAEIWLVRDGSPPTYEPLAAGGKNLWPMWSASDDRVFFMSDRSGSENLWSAPVGGGSEGQLTAFNDGRVLWPTMAVDRPLIAFEREFGIWTHDVDSDQTRQLDVQLMGSVEGPQPEARSETSGFSGLAVSPDEKKAAFVVRGEIFAAPTEGEGPATRVTHTAAAEGNVTWSTDSKQIVFTSWASGTPQLYAYDFTTGQQRRLTTGERRDANPTFSPDGRYLAYGREGKEVRVIDWASGDDRLLATGTSGSGSITWSPDSEWVAYGGRTDEFTNAFVVPAEGGEPRQVSFLANSNFGSLRWSATGDYLVFRTGQRTEPGKLVRVDLVPLTPTFQEDRFLDLFNVDPSEREPDEEVEAPPSESGPAAPVPTDVRVEFEDIRRRGNFVSLDFSVNSILLSPDGKHGMVSGGGGLHYLTFEEDGGVDVRSVSPSGPGGAGQAVRFSADGRELYLLRGGRIQVMNVTSGNTRPVSTTAEFEVDFEQEKMAVFEQGWGEMRDGFYDEEFHGADWDRVKQTFAPQIAGARTRGELGRLMNLMLGELNGSHLGFNGGNGGRPRAEQTGRLGLRFDRTALEEDGRFRVNDLIDLGPAHIEGSVEEGEYIVAIDGVRLDESTNLDELLMGKSGDKVAVSVASDPTGSGAREIELQPIGLGAERQLVYRSWVEGRRAFVEERSGGRLGYVHIASMSQQALDQFIFDLDQGNHAKDGVVIDVRNNNGGFVNVYAIDVLSRQNYFTMENRNGVEAPSRVQLGQRALLAPTVLVTNQHTLSDGEDFTEGYRELGLGKIVGEPTAGWIIYTGSAGLVDGSSVRMPRTKIRDTRGQVMELNPRQVDIEVERATGESYLGRDSQLERAIDELMTQLGLRRTTSDGSGAGG